MADASLKVRLRIKVYKPDGKVRYDSGQRKSKSFVLQFLQHIESAMSVSLAVSVRDTGNTLRTIAYAGYYGTDFNSRFLDIDAAVGNASHGIVVGSGTAAESNTDYALQTQIVHGVAAGQLQYSAASMGAAAVVGANVDYAVSRTFTNNSGGTVSINEVGIYVLTSRYTWAFCYFCIIRDLVTQVDVLNGETVEVIYTFRTTV